MPQLMSHTRPRDNLPGPSVVIPSFVVTNLSAHRNFCQRISQPGQRGVRVPQTLVSDAGVRRLCPPPRHSARRGEGGTVGSNLRPVPRRPASPRGSWSSARGRVGPPIGVGLPWRQPVLHRPPVLHRWCRLGGAPASSAQADRPRDRVTGARRRGRPAACAASSPRRMLRRRPFDQCGGTPKNTDGQDDFDQHPQLHDIGLHARQCQKSAQHHADRPGQKSLRRPWRRYHGLDDHHLRPR